MFPVAEFYVIVSTHFDERLVLREMTEKLINYLVITALLIAITVVVLVNV